MSLYLRPLLTNLSNRETLKENQRKRDTDEGAVRNKFHDSDVRNSYYPDHLEGDFFPIYHEEYSEEDKSILRSTPGTLTDYRLVSQEIWFGHFVVYSHGALDVATSFAVSTT